MDYANMLGGKLHWGKEKKESQQTYDTFMKEPQSPDRVNVILSSTIINLDKDIPSRR